jgi:hypothetical protein
MCGTVPAAKEVEMGYAYKMGHSGRACVRCGKELTDAASMECGIGPVCRKLDNKLLAQSIPANLSLAQDCWNMIDIGLFDGATYATAQNVSAALFADDAASRTDWRTEVKRLEWMLSFPTNVQGSLLPLTTSVVHALGYVGLAALWTGKASTGEATVTFVNGNLHVHGPRNADFRAAVKKVAGWRFHGPVGDSQPSWSLPAAAADSFAMLVKTYYPNHDAVTLSSVVTEAKAYVAALAPAPVPAHAPLKVPNMSKVRIEASSMEWLNVFAPFNANFIADLKLKLPSKMRRWNPVAKCWEVHAAHLSALKGMVATHSKETVDAPVAPAVDTPVVMPTLPAGVLPF